MSAPELRLADDADFAAIATITNHYIRATTVHFATAPVTAGELLAARGEHGGVHAWLVAAQGRTVLGYAKAGPFRARAAYRWTAETGIYLDPDHVGNGIGRPLYARLLAVLRAQGFHAAIGGIALPNDPSVRLHERLGFRLAGTIERAGWKHGRWIDIGFWRLALRGDDHEPAPLLPPAHAFAATAATG